MGLQAREKIEMIASVSALLDAGRLVRVSPGPRKLPGEPGSGYTSAASIGHVEPEEIFVLGTSHLSERSVIEVEAAIELLRPDAVVVELCRSRSALLYSDEAAADDMRARNPFSLSGEGGLLQSMQRSVALGGWAPLILRVFLARASDRLGAETRVAPGADFRAARRAAERVGASLILGDRPIEITLERAWRSLSLRDRWRLVRSVADGRSASSPSPSPSPGPGPSPSPSTSTSTSTSIEKSERDASELIQMALDDDDILSQYEALLAREFPSLVAPLVRERDVFLSLTIKSSYAVSGKRRVLGVVGQGHLRGVVRALGEEHTGQFRELCRTPSRELAKQKVLGVPRPLATRLAIDSSIGLLACAWWQGLNSGLNCCVF